MTFLHKIGLAVFYRIIFPEQRVSILQKSYLPNTKESCTALAQFNGE